MSGLNDSIAQSDPNLQELTEKGLRNKSQLRYY